MDNQRYTASTRTPTGTAYMNLVTTPSHYSGQVGGSFRGNGVCPERETDSNLRVEEQKARQPGNYLCDAIYGMCISLLL